MAVGGGTRGLSGLVRGAVRGGTLGGASGERGGGGFWRVAGIGEGVVFGAARSRVMGLRLRGVGEALAEAQAIQV